MGFQFSQRDLLPHRQTVVENMQVGFLIIDDFFACRIFYVSIPDVPFLRYAPIKNRRSTRHALNGQWDMLLEDSERLAHTVARQASANRVELSDQLIH